MTLETILIELSGAAICGITFAGVTAELLTWRWRKASLDKGRALERQLISSEAIERKLLKTEGELATARNEAVYWERVARNFEDEVVKILAGGGV